MSERGEATIEMRCCKHKAADPPMVITDVDDSDPARVVYLCTCERCGIQVALFMHFKGQQPTISVGEQVRDD